MMNLKTICQDILAGILIVGVIAAGIYSQYRAARWRSDRKDEKADIQTLFDGRK